MPSETKHYRQYQKNKQLVNEDCLNDISNTLYLDWVITIYFYAAVHLIEKKLAAHNQHTYSHKARNKAINAIKDFEPIREVYQTLYMESRKARYNCIKYTPKKVNSIKDKLFNVIENQLAS